MKLNLSDFRDEIKMDVRKTIREEFDRFISFIDTKKVSSSIESNQTWVTQAGLAKELKISRQTINKWHKRPSTSNIMDSNSKLIGKKRFYDLEKLRAAIRQERHLFSGGREYRFLLASQLTAEEKTLEALSKLETRRMYRGLTEEEEAEYQELLEMKEHQETKQFGGF